MRSWLQKIRDQDSLRLGTEMLVAAGVVVGGAIAAEGTVGRGLNGVAGLLWLGSAGLIGSALWRAPRRWTGAVLVGAEAVTLVLLVKPADVALAAVGFGAAGALAALVMRERPSAWARLLPAIWLPTHLGVALVRAVATELTGGTPHVRTQPPPTAAVVPLVMILAAWLGGALVERLRQPGGEGNRSLEGIGD